MSLDVPKLLMVSLSSASGLDLPSEEREYSDEMMSDLGDLKIGFV